MKTARRLLLLALGLGLALGPTSAIAAAPLGVPNLTLIHGQLRTAGGDAYDGAVDMVVRIYADADADTPIYTETLPSVPVASSRFAVFVGAAPDDPFGLQLADVFGAYPETEMSLTIDGDAELPRRPLGHVPYAIHASQADHATDADVAAVAHDLDCVGCVQATETGFTYAGSDGKGGAASDLDCPGCVGAGDVGVSQVGSAHIQDGGVSSTDVAFNYAGSMSKGGAASDVACVGCVEASDIGAGAVDTAELADGSVTAAKLGEACADGQVLAKTAGGWVCQDAGALNGGRIVAVHPIYGGEEGGAEVSLDTWQTISKTIYHLNAPNPGLVEASGDVEHWLVMRIADTINTCGLETSWRFWFSWASKPGHAFNVSRHWGSTSEGSVRWVKVPSPSAQASAWSISPAYWRLEAKLPSTCGGHRLRVFNIDLVEIERSDASPAALAQADTAGSSAAAYNLGGPGGNAIRITEDLKFGLSKSVPEARLHVGGDIRADSDIRGSSLTSDGAVTASGAVSAGGTITAPFFKAGQGHSASVTAGNWYRIASNTGNRAGATFSLRDTISSGGHSWMTIQIGASYNFPSGLSLTMLNHGKYGTTTFERVRVLMGTTYQPMYVEVFVGRTGAVDYSIYDNLSQAGWTPEDWTPGAVPAGYGAHEYTTDHLMMVGGNAQALTVERDGDVVIAGTVSAANVGGSTVTAGTSTTTGSATIAGTLGVGGATPPAGTTVAVAGKVDVGGELEADTVKSNGVVTAPFFKAGEGHAAGVTADNWYRIATNPGNRAGGTFTLRDFISSGGHSQMTFNVGISYGDAGGMSLTLVNHSRYGNVSFTKIRILEASTYEPMHLEVYCQRTGSVEYSLYDNLHSAGWTPVDWELGAVPAGYAVREFAVDNLFVVAGAEQYLTVARGGNTTVSKNLDVGGTVSAVGKIVASGGVDTALLDPSGGQVNIDGTITAPYFKAGEGNSANVATDTWYRIAMNAGNRASASFSLRDTISSGGHSQLNFRAGISYNDVAGISITLLGHHRYNTTTFDKVRIIEASTYDPQYLEVHVIREGSVDYSIYDNLNASGWVPVDWAVGSVPSGYTSHEYNLDRLFMVGGANEAMSVHRDGLVEVNGTLNANDVEVDDTLYANRVEVDDTLYANRIGVGTASPTSAMDVRGQHYFEAQYSLAQIEAQATCIALRSQAGFGGGWTYAVRRDCSSAAPTCAQVCGSIYAPQPGHYLQCFNSLHIYGNQPHATTAAMGLKTYLYNGCGGGCGPNYCCCSN